MPERSCSVKGCERPHRARGFCVVHYNERWHGRAEIDRLRAENAALREAGDGLARFKPRGWFEYLIAGLVAYGFGLLLWAAIWA